MKNQRINYLPSKQTIMKFRLYHLFSIGMLLLLASCTGKKNVTVRFSNPLGTALKEEVVRIPAEILPRQYR